MPCLAGVLRSCCSALVCCCCCCCFAVAPAAAAAGGNIVGESLRARFAGGSAVQTSSAAAAAAAGCCCCSAAAASVAAMPTAAAAQCCSAAATCWSVTTAVTLLNPSCAAEMGSVCDPAASKASSAGQYKVNHAHAAHSAGMSERVLPALQTHNSAGNALSPPLYAKHPGPAGSLQTHRQTVSTHHPPAASVRCSVLTPSHPPLPPAFLSEAAMLLTTRAAPGPSTPPSWPLRPAARCVCVVPPHTQPWGRGWGFGVGGTGKAAARGRCVQRVSERVFVASAVVGWL